MSSSALFQKRILITRSAKQAQDMVDILEKKGAVAIPFPVIQTRMVEQREALDKAILQLAQYEVLLFTSVNAVSYFFERAKQLFQDGQAEVEQAEVEQAEVEQAEVAQEGAAPVSAEQGDAAQENVTQATLAQEHVVPATTENKQTASAFWSLFHSKLKVAAIGPKTAQALRDQGITTLPLPEDYHQEGLVELMKAQIPVGAKILYPRVAEVREHLLQCLRELGMQIEDVITYQTSPVVGREEELGELLQNKKVDVITFTSASTVQSFVQLCQQVDGRSWLSRLAEVTIACIGPVTAAKARQLGLSVHVEARRYTIEAMLEELEEYFLEREGFKNE